MTTNEKMEAICGLDERANIAYSPYTRKFYVEARVEIGDGSTLTGTTEHRETPEEAVDAYWGRITSIGFDKVLVVNAMNDERRNVRWQGFMWKDVPMVSP